MVVLQLLKALSSKSQLLANSLLLVAQLSRPGSVCVSRQIHQRHRALGLEDVLDILVFGNYLVFAVGGKLEIVGVRFLFSTVRVNE